MNRNDAKLGILLMIATTFVFAVQDGISKYLATEYNPVMIIMVRYWFFALFVLAIAQRQGGIRRVAQTSQPLLQSIRGLLLVAEIVVMVTAFIYLGLIASLAVFTVYPLIIAALSGPILGEQVGWRRWAAIFVGFVGVMIIIRPGFGVFNVYALIPLLSACMFAVYGLLTRYAARKDSAQTSFFWTGIVGTIGISIAGVFYWKPLAVEHWGWMFALCVLGAIGHYLLIKCYEVAEASTVQPFAYFQFVFGAVIGLFVLGETLEFNTLVGVLIIIAAGIYTLWRERAAKA